MLQYCDKCGSLWHEVEGLEDKYNICDVCKNHLKIVPDEYFENPNFKLMLSKEMKQKLINDLVLTSPNFDQYYFDNRDQIAGQKRQELSAKMKHGAAVLEGREKGNRFGVECPYCHAANSKKITSTSRAVSAWMFGLGSKKIGKQWHCNNCGADF